MPRKRGVTPRRPYDHNFDPSMNMDTRQAWGYNYGPDQFDYDETLLNEGRYREWFYDGLQESQLAYLRQPARVDKVEQEPVGYDGWETEQPRRWEQEADCAGADSEIFLNSGNQPKLAYLREDAEWREYCPQCPVQDACLAAARESGSVGIWGGVYRYSPRNSSDLKNIEELDDRIPTTRTR